MRQTLFIFLLIGIFACNSEKEKVYPVFRGSELLSLANGSHKDFINLIDKAGFYVKDTLWGIMIGNEYTGYHTVDSKMPSNILKVHINKDSAVIFLSFETKSKNDFLQIREDFISAGFKVLKKAYAIEQLGKENDPMEILMQKSEKKSKTFYIFMGYEH